MQSSPMPRITCLLLTVITMSLVLCAIPVQLWAAEAQVAATDTQAVAADNSKDDPYERLNRSFFSFNDGFDKYLMKPVGKGYNAIMPQPLSRGVTNFFNNLAEPQNILNAALQGKFRQAGKSTFRFFINTVFGIGGLFEVAKHSGLKRHREDFGQTLAVWGVKESSYFVIPILGPSSTRDTVGVVVDFFTYPLLYMDNRQLRNWLYVLFLADRRANLLVATDVLDEAAGEYRYEFIREAYRQNRENAIYNGNPPLELPYLLEDDPSGDQTEVRP